MLSPSKLKNLYYYLKVPRYIEERMLLLLRQGKISKWFSGIGQEAISVGVTYALNTNDVIFPMHRNLGVFTTREVDSYKLFCQLFGKQEGFTNGRDRTFHFGTKEYNIIGMISHLAAMLPVANGIALAAQMRKENKIAVAFTGDGATSEGDFHEALNIAAVWNLPVMFVVENNGYGLSTPTFEQYKCKNLSDKAIGYGMEGVTIDGNDILEVYNTILKYREKIVKGSGPILIEAITFRMRGHEEASGVKYVPSKLIEKWRKKDPLLNYEKYLLKNKKIDKNTISDIDVSIENKFLPIIESALNAEVPFSTEEDEMNLVYCKDENLIINPNGRSSKKRFIDSIKEALYQKIDSDENVIIMGQDIAEYGGVFKVTDGFVDKFGKKRIRNTPIIESGIIGTAMGLAIEGFKPIVEMQFSDFVSVGFNQIVNNLAKTYYRWKQPVNVTLRLPAGGNIGAGPFHSQNNEAWFFHVPGLKIAYPSNPFDAKGLLVSSINENNPVLYFEHKFLYRTLKEDVPDSMYTIELGKASLVNKGSRITLVTYGLGVYWAKQYLENNKDMNNLIEIIDLRTLLPWDSEAVVKSLTKTNKLLILHEDNITGGIGAEISAYIVQNYFELLDAPIVRLGSLDTPIPFSSKLEKELYLPVSKIHKSIEKLLAY